MGAWLGAFAMCLVVGLCLTAICRQVARNASERARSGSDGDSMRSCLQRTTRTWEGAVRVAAISLSPFRHYIHPSRTLTWTGRWRGRSDASSARSGPKAPSTCISPWPRLSLLRPIVGSSAKHYLEERPVVIRATVADSWGTMKRSKRPLTGWPRGGRHCRICSAVRRTRSVRMFRCRTGWCEVLPTPMLLYSSRPQTDLKVSCGRGSTCPSKWSSWLHAGGAETTRRDRNPGV